MARPTSTPLFVGDDVAATAELVTGAGPTKPRATGLSARTSPRAPERPRLRRILVGYDGSDTARCAVEVAGYLAAGSDAHLRILTVNPDAAAVAKEPEPRAQGSPEGDEGPPVQAAEQLTEPTCHPPTILTAFETVMRRGRPGEVLGDEAIEFDADLIVVGSRGLGPLGSTLVGSVSQEVIDRAPCAVLVARSRPPFQQVVIGIDGSPGARVAERFMAELPIPSTASVSVVSVAEPFPVISTGVAPTLLREARAASADYAAASVTIYAHVAETAAERLCRAGLRATPSVRLGDPAAKLLTAAGELNADLIVLGSRHLTGLRRLVLCSVARRVL